MTRQGSTEAFALSPEEEARVTPRAMFGLEGGGMGLGVSEQGPQYQQQQQRQREQQPQWM